MSAKSLELRIWIGNNCAETHADTETPDDSLYCLTNTLLEISDIRKNFLLMYEQDGERKVLPETLELFDPDVVHDIYVKFIDCEEK